MPVYVDNMNAKYGRMIMCHMLADSEEELIEMANRIGVQRKWHQYPGTYRSHFDICRSKKELAIKYGAIEITYREAGRMLRNKVKYPKIIRDPDIRNGILIVKGTRIGIHEVRDIYTNDGLDATLECFPSLSLEDINQVIQYFEENYE